MLCCYTTTCYSLRMEESTLFLPIIMGAIRRHYVEHLTCIVLVNPTTSLGRGISIPTLQKNKLSLNIQVSLFMFMTLSLADQGRASCTTAHTWHRGWGSFCPTLATRNLMTKNESSRIHTLPSSGKYIRVGCGRQSTNLVRVSAIWISGVLGTLKGLLRT